MTMQNGHTIQNHSNYTATSYYYVVKPRGQISGNEKTENRKLRKQSQKKKTIELSWK